MEEEGLVPMTIPNGFAFYDIHERLYSIAIIPIEK
jgi:hypothetical protein